MSVAIAGRYSSLSQSKDSRPPMLSPPPQSRTDSSIQDCVYDAASGKGCSVVLRLASEAIDSVWPLLCAAEAVGAVAALAVVTVALAVEAVAPAVEAVAPAVEAVAPVVDAVAVAVVGEAAAGVGPAAGVPDCGEQAASNRLK